jgi:error-prone DNA polymerase
MEQLRARLYAGMAERGIEGSVADEIYDKLVAFANFGFPESHSVSFAYLVYASAWLKYHYPAAFCAGLLDGQPMGFWSPQTIVADARRHGVVVRQPDVKLSAAKSMLEPGASSAGGAVVRMGISYVRGVGEALAERIASERPYRDIEDLVRRTGVNSAQAEALATAGAFECFGLSRRAALWSAGAVAAAGSGPVEPQPLCSPTGPMARTTADHNGRAPRPQVRQARLSGLVTGADAPLLPSMDPVEANQADLWATGLSPDSYPTEFIRVDLAAAGVVTASGLMWVPAGERVTVAGIVTHRQRPATAQGVTFMNLEDETGLINVICSAGAWKRYRRVARASPALLIDGRLERVETVINVVAERIRPLSLRPGAALRSRDFR